MKIKKIRPASIILDESLASDAEIKKEIVQTTEYGEGEVLKSVEKLEDRAEEAIEEAEKTAEPVVKETASEHKDEVFPKVEESLEENKEEAKEESLTEEIDITDRHALADYIKECKENNIPFVIRRSVKEGFRYTLTKGISQVEPLTEDAHGDLVDELVTSGECEDRAEAEEKIRDGETDVFEEEKVEVEEEPKEECLKEEVAVPAEEAPVVEEAKEEVEQPVIEEAVEESFGSKFAKFYQANEDKDMTLFEDLFLKYNPEADKDIDEVVDAMNESDQKVLADTYLTEAKEELTESNFDKIMNFINANYSEEEPKEEALEEENKEVCPECGKEPCECEKCEECKESQEEEHKEEVEECKESVEETVPEAAEELTEAKKDEEEEEAKEEAEESEEKPEEEAEVKEEEEVEVEEPTEEQPVEEEPAKEEPKIDLSELGDDEVAFFEPLDSTLDVAIVVDEPREIKDHYDAGDFDFEDMVDSIAFVTADEDNPIEENKAFNFDIYKTTDGKFVAFGNETPFGPVDDVEELKNEIRDFMDKSDFKVTEEEQTFDVIHDDEEAIDIDGFEDESDLELEPKESEEVIAEVEPEAVEKAEEEKVEEPDFFDEEEKEEFELEDESDLDLASFDK